MVGQESQSTEDSQIKASAFGWCKTANLANKPNAENAVKRDAKEGRAATGNFWLRYRTQARRQPRN